MADFVVVIPARYGSSRLAAKVLLDIAGKPLLQRTYERCVASQAAEVIIATDHAEIATVAEGFGATVAMTAREHRSGTERINEVVQQHAYADDVVIVNVQADEPTIPPDIINQVATNLADHQDADMATLMAPLEEVDLQNPHVVKVVMSQAGYALYFSRAPIPWSQAHEGRALTELHYHHIGIYAYRCAFLQQYCAWAPSPLEQVESLEQLRALYYGAKIHVAEAVALPAVEVNTAEDLVKAQQYFDAM